MFRLMWFGVFLIMLSASMTTAQDAPVINADNFLQLQSVKRIDFENVPEEVGRIDNGLFMLNDDATRIATVNRDNHIIVWDDDSNIVDTIIVIGADGLPGTFIGGVLSFDGRALAALFTDGASHLVTYHNLVEQTTDVVPFAYAPDTPITIWFDADASHIWFEVLPENPEDPQYVVQLPVDDLNTNTPQRFFNVPGNDVDAFARIGRVLPPFAITATESGLVKRWNLEQDAVTATVELGDIPVFGRINPQGSHLAWRDPFSQFLHLLAFETGEDQVIAPLHGDIVPFVLLGQDVDVIFGVNVNLESNVLMWEVATGVRHHIGEFRQCGREQPDMVRLSRDGSTLVIGCQTGLEIWRVTNR